MSEVVTGPKGEKPLPWEGSTHRLTRVVMIGTVTTFKEGQMDREFVLDPVTVLERGIPEAVHEVFARLGYQPEYVEEEEPAGVIIPGEVQHVGTGPDHGPGSPDAGESGGFDPNL